MLNFKKLSKSFYFAAKGLSYVFKNEQNFRVQLGVGILVLLFIILFKVTVAETIILILLITLVLVLEVINTIFEKMVDLLKPRLHSYVEIIKDMMSATVLISTIGAAVIGTIIFGPYLLALL